MLSFRLAALAIYPIGIPFSSVGIDHFQHRQLPAEFSLVNGVVSSALPATRRLVERAVHTDLPRWVVSYGGANGAIAERRGISRRTA